MYRSPSIWAQLDAINIWVMSPAQSRDFSAWMSGWFSYQTRREFVDIELHQKNIANLKAWCQYHPQEGVMAGLQRGIGLAVNCLSNGERATERNVLLIAAILLVAGSLPSAAQIRVDMNNMTCGNWLGYSPDNREFVRYWMSGYYNAASNSNVLNYDRLQKKFRKGCGVLQKPQVTKSADRDQECRFVGLRRIASRRCNWKARAMSAVGTKRTWMLAVPRICPLSG